MYQQVLALIFLTAAVFGLVISIANTRSQNGLLSASSDSQKNLTTAQLVAQSVVVFILVFIILSGGPFAQGAASATLQSMF